MEHKFCIYPLVNYNFTVPFITPCCTTMMDSQVASDTAVLYSAFADEVWRSYGWSGWRKMIAMDDYTYCDKCSQKNEWVTESELRDKYPEIADDVMAFKAGDETKLTMPPILILSYDQSCNLRCVTCRPSGKALAAYDVETVTDRVMRVLPYARRVIVAGDGEIAVSKNYRKILAAIKAPTKVTLMSNGTRLNMDFWASLPDEVISCIDRVHISCDGTTKEIYESVRLNGSFDEWVENMMILAILKKQHGWKTKLMYTVGKKNYGDFRNVSKFARELEFDEIFVNHAAEWHRLLSDGSDWKTDQCLERYETRLVSVVSRQMMKDYVVLAGGSSNLGSA